MSYTARVYRVFIASPSDVGPERNLIRSTVWDWNVINAASRGIVLEPVGWETHAIPSLGDRPQAIINKQILEDADLLIAVFWTRLGTATGNHLSGTVEEIEEHIAAGKPAMIYFSDAPVRLDSVDESQYQALVKFRKELQQRGLIESYSDFSEFAMKLNRQLNQRLNDGDIFKGTVSSTEQSTAQGSSIDTGPPQTGGLSDDALGMLLETAKGDGRIMKIRHLGGIHIQLPGGVVDTSTPRLAAKWTSAIEELEQTGHIRSLGYKGEIYEITEKGYQLCEKLNK